MRSIEFEEKRFELHMSLLFEWMYNVLPFTDSELVKRGCIFCSLESQFND